MKVSTKNYSQEEFSHLAAVLSWFSASCLSLWSLTTPAFLGDICRFSLNVALYFGFGVLDCKWCIWLTATDTWGLLIKVVLKCNLGDRFFFCGCCYELDCLIQWDKLYWVTWLWPCRHMDALFRSRSASGVTGL